jgi:HJR/Mrr/RecB family endonuclease
MTGSGKSPPDGIYYAGVFALIVLLIYLRLENVGLIEQLKVLLAGFLLVGTVVAVFYVAWHVRNMPTTPTAVELSRRFEEVRFMSGAQFEVFVADLFRAMGHQATLLGGAGDQGVDIVVDRRGERVAVQCKNYQRPANNKPVQEVFAGAQYHRCVEAWVVAPAGYTRGAIELAKSTGVSLYDANTIRRWIGEVDKLEKERASETEFKTRHPSPENSPINKEITEARKRAIWHPHPDDPPDS